LDVFLLLTKTIVEEDKL